jgi:hypothetical protein
MTLARTPLDDRGKGLDVRASIPGQGSFTVTAEAAAMIGVFGGTLHCYQGAGGCRRQGLYFSRTQPKKYLRCTFPGNAATGHGTPGEDRRDETSDITISVSHDLAGKLDGAVLDFGMYDKMHRFVWAALPAVKTPSCTCLRSVGPPSGRRSPCLDDRGVGLSDL